MLTSTAATGVPANAVRLDPDRHPGLAGLPIPSTERLTGAERDALRTAARVCRLLADRFDEALEVGRVDCALEATRLAGDAGVRVQQLRELLGRGR